MTGRWVLDETWLPGVRPLSGRQSCWRDPARSPRGRLAGDLLVGLYAGGVQTEWTTFTRVRSRTGAV